MTYTIVYDTFSQNIADFVVLTAVPVHYSMVVLFKRQVWGEAGEVGRGEVGEGTEIVDGMKTDTLTAERVDGFGLLEA